MNKKKRWRVESFLSGALAMLGFAGCSSENEDILCAYGSPSVDYRVVGTVTNEQGEPLKDIQVVIDNPIAYGYYDDNGNFITEESTSTANPDTVYTDKDGRFSSHLTNAFDDSDLVWIFRILTVKTMAVNSSPNTLPKTSLTRSN